MSTYLINLIRAMLVGSMCAAGIANAQLTVSDDFTVGHNSLSWTVTGGACLTAGDGTAGAIPACSTSGQTGGYGDNVHPLGYLRAGVLDPVGNGALRLTNATGNQAGAILYNGTFPSNLGISITFTAVSYDGNSYAGADGGTNGADGLSFFLIDSSLPNLTPAIPIAIGEFGGSLGYSCSQGKSPGDGATGGYVGLGIDEYGNFLNSGDNTASGVANTSGSHGQFQGNRIGVRGAGMVNWAQLNRNYPAYYPNSLSSSNRVLAVQYTCQTGTLWDFSNANSPSNTTHTVANGITLTDYAPIQFANAVLPAPIANESAGARNATASSTGATQYTYNLKIGSGGAMTLTYISSATGATQHTIATNWPIFASNGTLPANFTFGFAASTGSGTNIHEITCFQAAPADDSDSSAGVNLVQTGQVKTGTQVYLAFYHSNDWWGQLTSQYLVTTAATATTQQSVSLNPVANWDAACVLTGDTAGTTLLGGKCKATNSTADTAEASAYSAASRQILTWDGVSSGQPFEWANLTTAQKNALGSAAGDDNHGSIRVDYLRGDRSHETTASGGVFRARIAVLGDIAESSPTWVGAPQSLYPSGTNAPLAQWADSITLATMPENTNTYGAFENTYATRLNVVFAGANDGMMHGFETGSYDSTGLIYIPGTNDGKEVIAYMPNAVVNSIHNSADASLDYSSPAYSRNYYVDATPGIGDLYYNCALPHCVSGWHTWLVSGLGAGGNAVFALDITNPTQFSEAHAGWQVIGEWGTGALGSNLGQTFGTPLIKRFHTGNWAMVFGNGYNAGSHNGGIFIGQVSQANATAVPTVTFSFLALPTSASGTGTGGNANGIFSVYLADLDGDDVIDYIYAADLFGNVWRWDVTSSNIANWGDPTPQGSPASPIQLFSNGTGHPVSTQVQVMTVPNPGGRRRVMVDFGTGEQIQSPTSTTYATGQQALFGIWDGNMTSWNAKTTQPYKYATFPTALVTQPYTVTPSNLEAQTSTQYTTAGASIITMSNNTVCWAGLANCSTAPQTPQYGWTYALAAPGSNNYGEQVVFNPVVQDGAFVVNTFITSNTQNCTTAAPTGWTYAINPATGGAFNTSFFGNSPTSGAVAGSAQAAAIATADTAAATAATTAAAADALEASSPSAANLAAQIIADNASITAAAHAVSVASGANTSGSLIASGMQLGASGSASFVYDNSTAYMISQQLNAAAAGSGTGGGSTVMQVNPQSGSGFRLNWTELQ